MPSIFVWIVQCSYPDGGIHGAFLSEEEAIAQADKYDHKIIVKVPLQGDIAAAFMASVNQAKASAAASKRFAI